MLRLSTNYLWKGFWKERTKIKCTHYIYTHIYICVYIYIYTLRECCRGGDTCPHSTVQRFVPVTKLQQHQGNCQRCLGSLPCMASKPGGQGIDGIHPAGSRHPPINKKVSCQASASQNVKARPSATVPRQTLIGIVAILAIAVRTVIICISHTSAATRVCCSHCTMVQPILA